MSKKEDILKVALRLFAEKGFRDTSMSELSKITGAAEGTIFYHFTTKEDIFLTILENARKEIIGEFDGYLGEKRFENGLGMMDGVILFYLYIAVKMEHPILLLHRHFPYELAVANPVCREHLEAIYNCIVDFFERAIVLGQKDGSIAEMPARKTALLIFTMVDGLVRFKSLNLCDITVLYDHLIKTCHRMLRSEAPDAG